MRTPTLLSLVLLAACQTQTPAPATQTAEPTLEEIVLDSMNRDVDPCVDFYEYSCGTWIDTSEIPSDKARISRGFSTIYDRNQLILKAMLEDLAQNASEDADQQKLGAFYAACMDTETIQDKGLTPLKPQLESIDGIKDTAGLMPVVADLQMRGVDVLFGLGVLPDFKNPTFNILMLSQGGTALPEKSYYLSEDADKVRVRTAYQVHLTRMFQLLGEDEQTASASADTVLSFERALARISRAPVELRDPNANYNKIDLAGLEGLTPHLDFSSMLAHAGYGSLTQASVGQPEFFEGLDALIAETPIEHVKTYLRWQALHANASLLTEEVQAESFDFFSRTLAGQVEDQVRWKQCVNATDSYLGDALGKEFVAKEFPGDSKQVAVDMIHRVERSITDGFDELQWMDAATAEAATAKMDAITNKIGYPDEWQDYSTLALARDDYFGNVQAGRVFESHFWLDMAEKDVDPKLWFISAPTVNAYYNPLGNEIVFPAGILQAPFFDRDFPKAMNYGGMGMVMGHEVTHGFDDTGRLFAPDGSLVEWWAPEVTAKFEERAECVRDLYSGFEVLPASGDTPALHLNGELTAGENIADLGGIKHAYGAYKTWVAENGPETLGDMTGEQLFFVAHAQTWCTKRTDAIERMFAAMDTHSTPRWRVNGALSQFPEFGEVFECEVGAPMRPEQVCEVW